MYFGHKEIEKVDGNIVTFVDGTSLEIVEAHKELFTDTLMESGKLQRFWHLNMAKKIYNVLTENNVRINDIQAILQTVEEILNDKLNEQMVNTIGKQKLDTFAQVFGAGDEVVTPLSHRAIRMQDLFNS